MCEALGKLIILKVQFHQSLQLVFPLLVREKNTQDSGKQYRQEYEGSEVYNRKHGKGAIKQEYSQANGNGKIIKQTLLLYCTSTSYE